MLSQADLFDTATPAPPAPAAVRPVPPPRPQANPAAARLWLSLHLPQLPLEVFPHIEPDDPVVITEAYEGKLLVDVKTGGKSFTAREVEFLEARGYRWDLDYTGPGAGRLVPPDVPSLDTLPRVP